VLYRLRFGVLPMLLILPFFDVGAWIAQHWDLESTWFAGGWGALRATYCAQLFMGVVMVLMPLALLPLWGVRPLPPDAVTVRLAECCRRTGVAVAGLMCWPESGSRIYNAMVIGVAPRLRYVLFSKDLVRDMPAEQVEAVLGHELGHARHGHLWTYFLYFNVAFLVAMLGEPVLTRLLLPPVLALLGALGFALDAVQVEAVVSVAGMLLVVGALWRLGFGALSRACERQADLAGAELAGDPRLMGAALRSVARLSGQPETEPSWCHHSIAERIAYLERVAAQPTEAACHHRLVRTIWRALAVLFIVLLLLALWLTFPGGTQHGLPATRFQIGAGERVDPDGECRREPMETGVNQWSPA
jgi:Zn-dependent protease with chaperone function